MIDPPEVFVVDSARVKCDGGGDIAPALGHPRVWLEIDEKGYADCGYCDRRFVLRGGPAERTLHEVSPGELMPEKVARA
ncbi:MAG: zinc-finger domain-containing protein [Novosphingobium sp.]